MQKITALFSQGEIFVFMAIAVALRWQDIHLPFFWDEILFYARAAQWLSIHGIYRALPGLHPPGIFGGHLPGYSLLLASASLIFGFSVETLRVLMLFLTCIQLYFTYRLAVFLANRWAGLMAAIALFSIPTVYAHSIQVLSDVAVASLGTAACYFACKRESNKYLLLSIFAAALKETSLAFSAPIFAHKIICSRTKFKENPLTTWRYFPAVIVVLGFFVSEKIFTGKLSNFPFLNTLSLDPIPLFGRFIEYGMRYLFQGIGSGALFLSAFSGAAVISIRGNLEKRETVSALLLVILAYWIGISAFTMINIRYFLPIFPLFCVLGTAGAVIALGRFQFILGFALLGWIIICVPRYFGSDSVLGAGWEGCLQYREMIAVHRQVAEYLESKYPNASICAAWPLDIMLSDSKLGYLTHGLKVTGVYPSKAPCELLVLAENSALKMYDEQTNEIISLQWTLDREFNVKGKIAQIWQSPKRQNNKSSHKR